jgi:hypothetical protein
MQKKIVAEEKLRIKKKCKIHTKKTKADRKNHTKRKEAGSRKKFARRSVSLQNVAFSSSKNEPNPKTKEKTYRFRVFFAQTLNFRSASIFSLLDFGFLDPNQDSHAEFIFKSGRIL